MDAYMSEIVAVIDDKHDEDLDEVVGRLKKAGVEISNINRSEWVVEGLVDSSKIKTIDEMKGVEYVRTVFTYVANYPPGDPRDRDGR